MLHPDSPYAVGIYPRDIDRNFETLEEAQESCASSYFHGLDCYIYERDRFGQLEYIEKRLVTDRCTFITDRKGHITTI